MKHVFFQQLPLGCRNLQSWLFDLFARDRAGRTIAPRTWGDMGGTPNRPGLNCPPPWTLGMLRIKQRRKTAYPLCVLQIMADRHKETVTSHPPKYTY